MFGCIKRMINWERVEFDSKWENLNNDEMLSMIASSGSENEIKRLAYLLEKDGGTRTLFDVSQIKFTAENTGLVFFTNNNHPVFFFSEVQKD